MKQNTEGKKGILSMTDPMTEGQRVGKSKGIEYGESLDGGGGSESVQWKMEWRSGEREWEERG